MGDRLKDKVAIVTGSGHGVGRAVAIALAKEGAKVVTNDISAVTAESAAKEITDSGGQAFAYPADVSSFEQVGKMTRAAVDKFGKLDILVNNAATFGVKPFWELTEADFDRFVAVNLKGTFNCDWHVCSIMKEQKHGRIVNTTSRGRLGSPEHAVYNATKAGIVGLTRAVARDMGRFGIYCNAYGPGAASWGPPSEEQKARWDKDLKDGLMSKDFYKKMMDLPPAEAAAALPVFLCTDEAKVNGVTFEILGGEIGIYTEEERKRIEKKSGYWTVDEVAKEFPKLLKGVNIKLFGQ